MKYRTGFVTNSSSANYSVTITLEDRKKRSLEMKVSTYGGPYYKDTRDGCDINPARSASLGYYVPYVFQRSDPSSFPPDLGSLRNLSRLLLNSVTSYGYGYSYDWWRTEEGEEYFCKHWLRERLAEAAEEGVPGDDLDLSDFNYEYYLAELRGRGVVMLNDDTSKYGKCVDNICGGWRFAIAGSPSVYSGRDHLEDYIYEHGGEVDERMGNQTDFLIWCNNPYDGPIGKPFWQSEYEDREGQWGIWAGFSEDEPGDPDPGGDEPDNPEPGGGEPGDLGPGGDEPDNPEPGSFEGFLQSFEDPESRFEEYFEGPVDSGYTGFRGWNVYCSDFVISEAEFVRRFDPQQERDKGMTIASAYPLLVMRLEQVCKSRGIDPNELRTVTYHFRINTFGDSCYELGFYWKDEGVTINLKNGKANRWCKMN